MPETQVIRARGYLAFCVAVGASGLVASVLALTHRDAAGAGGLRVGQDRRQRLERLALPQPDRD